MPRPATKSSVSSQPSIKDSFFLTRGDLRHINVYAEVRGKYARPAFLNNKKPENTQLTVKENPFLVRPTTSGSLKPRNALSTAASHRKTQSVILEIPEEPVKIQENRKKTEERGQRLQENIKIDEKASDSPRRLQKVKHNSTQIDPETYSESSVKPEIEDSNAELPLDTETSETLDQVLDLPENQSMKSSNYSSSSQRRIMELEALLEEEKTKRAELEQSLKKMIKNSLINS